MTLSYESLWPKIASQMSEDKKAHIDQPIFYNLLLTTK